jgi:hypothetical protein
MKRRSAKAMGEARENRVSSQTTPTTAASTAMMVTYQGAVRPTIVSTTARTAIPRANTTASARIVSPSHSSLMLSRR